MSIPELGTQSQVEVEMITCVIDGFEITVPKGTLVIRAAEKLGITQGAFSKRLSKALEQLKSMLGEDFLFD